jgi:hypothetical protein
MKRTFTLILIGAILGSTVAFAASKVFSDVPANEWYTSAVNSLSEKGIIAGYPDNTFRPTKNINRAELAVMLDRLIEYMESGEVASSDTSDVCTAAPTTTDIGRDVYPIASEYDHLPFLGQLFTAYDCGSNRVNQLFGVNNGTYTLGSYIELQLPDAKNTDVATVLEDIGFVCMGGYDYCDTWQLDESADVDDLIKIREYSNVIYRDDCVNCG